MATVTGTNLLAEVLADTGATMPPAVQLITAARLQQMIDAGFDAGLGIALVLSAASSEIRTAVPVLGDLTTIVETAQTDIEADTADTLTFSLAKGIADLQAAEDAVTDFLAAADGDDDPLTSTTEAAVNASDDAAIAALDVLVPGDYTNASPAVRAALLSDEQTAVDTALADAQADLADAQADVAAVAGLTAAVDAYNAAVDASDAADALVAPTGSLTADLSAALAAFNTLNGTALTLEADGTDTGADVYIELVDGDLALVDGIDETTNPGVTALLNASIAFEAGQAAAAAAATAETAALEVVNNLDLNAAAVTALEAVGAGMTVVTPADVDAPTQAEIAAEVTGLAALATTAATTAALTAAAAGAAAADDAAAAAAVTAATTTQATLDAAIVADNTADAQVVTDTAAVATAATALAAAVLAADTGEGDTVNTDATISPGTIVVGENGGITATVEGVVNQIVAMNVAGTITLAASFDAPDANVVALVAASQAKEDADVDLFASTAAAVTTQNALDAAILADTAADALVVSTAATAALTDAAALAAAAAVDATAAADAAADVADFDVLVAAYDAAAATNPLLTALTTAEGAVDTAQDDVDALADAVADLADATADVAALADLNDAITAAEDAFIDAGYEVPVTLVAGANIATADSDIFLADDSVAGASITNFSLLGDDTLFIGTDFTYNAGDIADEGVNTVLEVFLTEVAGSTVITMETELWSSNSADAENTITLTGVALADVTLADGFITVA